MKHFTIGIDPSINSTGICIHEVNTNHNIYYIVSSKPTKKTIEYCNSSKEINLCLYKKLETKGVEEYYMKEKIKSKNIHNIVNIIEDIICNFFSLNTYILDYIVMEGVSYGSVKGAALVDLAFLNSAIREMLYRKNYLFYIVAPTEVKKYAVGNGAAEKDTMIMSWKKIDKNISNLPDWFKCDDIADAFFMAYYNPEFSE